MILAAETFDLLDVSGTGVVVLGGVHPAWTSYDYQWLLSVCSGGNSTITRKQWLHYVYNLVKAGETSGGALEASSEIVDHLDALVGHIRGSGPEKLIAADRTASILSVQAEKAPGVAASDHTQLNAVRRRHRSPSPTLARAHAHLLTWQVTCSLAHLLTCSPAPAIMLWPTHAASAPIPLLSAPPTSRLPVHHVQLRPGISCLQRSTRTGMGASTSPSLSPRSRPTGHSTRSLYSLLRRRVAGAARLAFASTYAWLRQVAP